MSEALLASGWTGVVPPDRYALAPAYLDALESARPPRLAFRRATLERAGETLAVAALQDVAFSPHATLHGLVNPSAARGWRRWVRTAAAPLLAPLGFRALLVGDVFAGGEPGLAWREPLGADAAYAWAAAAMDDLRARDEASARPHVLVFKDVGEADLPAARRVLGPLGYHEAIADPVMVLELDPRWRTFGDYLAALNARYRSHARQALRASASVERRLLDAAEILARAERIDRLHATVLERALVRPSTLDARAWAAFAAELGERFAFVGYFHEGELVGFNTRFLGGDHFESHYCGVHEPLNRPLALYRSILYDDIETAIVRGARRISFGRTSQEMKSALGARPQAMTWFGRSVSRVPVAPLCAITGLVRPAWTARQPFRAACRTAR